MSFNYSKLYCLRKWFDIVPEKRNYAVEIEKYGLERVLWNEVPIEKFPNDRYPPLYSNFQGGILVGNQWFKLSKLTQTMSGFFGIFEGKKLNE